MRRPARGDFRVSHIAEKSPFLLGFRWPKLHELALSGMNEPATCATSGTILTQAFRGSFPAAGRL